MNRSELTIAAYNLAGYVSPGNAMRGTFTAVDNTDVVTHQRRARGP